MYKGACLAVHRDARGRHRSRLADAASKHLLIEAEFAALPAHTPSLSCRCRAPSRKNLRVIAFLSSKATRDRPIFEAPVEPNRGTAADHRLRTKYTCEPARRRAGSGGPSYTFRRTR